MRVNLRGPMVAPDNLTNNRATDLVGEVNEPSRAGQMALKFFAGRRPAGLPGVIRFPAKWLFLLIGCHRSLPS